MNLRSGPLQWLVLAAAGGASFYGASHIAAPGALEDAAEPIVRVAAAQTGPVAGATDATSALIAPRASGPTREPIEPDAGGDAFRGMSWTPPPPPAPPPPVQTVQQPPPPPSAPPLPFRFVGMLQDGSATPTAFLAKGDALHVVRIGDQIDGAYRVDSLSPTQVVLTYLPLKQQQVLPVAGSEQ